MSAEPARATEVFFLRITPFNWVVARWYARSRTVSYWRSTLPQRLLAGFHRLEVENVLTRDQWLLISDAAFDLWRDRIYPYLAASCHLTQRYRGATIDFSLLLHQQLSQEFERVFQLCRTLEIAKGPGAVVIEPWFARVLPPALMAEVAGRCTLVASAANRALEPPYEWAFALGHLLRLAGSAVRRLYSAPIAPARGSVLWTGIAPQEIPSQPHRLDFAWPSRFAGIPSSKIVYFLPIEPSAAQRRYFERDGVLALGPTEIARLAGRSAAWRALGAAALAAIRALLAERSAVAPYRALFAARGLIWVDIADALAPRTYMTTTSYCWPERPEVAALAARGVPARIWSYSANALTFAHDTPHRDLAVWRTAFLAREFWAWNAAYRDWMLRRQIGAAAHQPRFRVAGPLMCGDATWLARDRSLAKRQIGLDPHRYYLAVFDVPRSGTGHRRTFYGGPRMFSDEYHEPFYRALIDLLETHRKLNIFIKLKRPTSSQWHTFPKSQLDLIDESSAYAREGRVAVVHQDTDPYLPIAACDAALGMMYTSPVLAALAQGKPGAYFDPVGLARYPSEPAYEAVTISSADQLQATVGAWLEGRDDVDHDAVSGLLPIPEAGFDVAAAAFDEEKAATRDRSPAQAARGAATAPLA